MPRDQAKKLAGGDEFFAGFHHSNCTRNERTTPSDIPITSVPRITLSSYGSTASTSRTYRLVSDSSGLPPLPKGYRRSALGSGQGLSYGQCNAVLPVGYRKRKRQLRDTAASIKARLLSHAKKNREAFDLVLVRYALERLLYRLTESRHRDRFVVKGAILFQVWSNLMHRPTRDLDLLAAGDPAIETFGEIFRELCAQAVWPSSRTDLSRMSCNAGPQRRRSEPVLKKFGMAWRKGIQRISKNSEHRSRALGA